MGIICILIDQTPFFVVHLAFYFFYDVAINT